MISVCAIHLGSFRVKFGQGWVFMYLTFVGARQGKLLVCSIPVTEGCSHKIQQANAALLDNAPYTNQCSHLHTEVQESVEGSLMLAGY